MANTDYTHAGNADKLRAMQNIAVARCNLCHFYLGQEVNTETVTLQPVQLGKHTALVCQLCVKLCKQVGDDDFTMAATMVRPLTPEDEAENQKIIQAFEAERDADQTEDLTHY